MNYMNIAKPDAVIFDLDGLMIDTEALAFKSYDKVTEVLGVEIPHDLRLQTVGLPFSKFPDLFEKTLPKGTDIDAVMRISDEHYHHSLKFGELTLKPGLMELLDFLQAAEFPIAVATSSCSVTSGLKMNRSGLSEYFEEVVTVDDVARGKPSPDLFLEAAKRLNKKAHTCLVLEDSKLGVKGAAAAGMHVINVPDIIEPDEEIRQLAIHICEDLFEVKSLIEEF